MVCNPEVVVEDDWDSVVFRMANICGVWLVSDPGETERRPFKSSNPACRVAVAVFGDRIWVNNAFESPGTWALRSTWGDPSMSISSSRFLFPPTGVSPAFVSGPPYVATWDSSVE